MDVFGTVMSAIDLVNKLVGYLQSVKGAREDRQKLLSEVSALGALLEVLQGRLHGSSMDGSSDSISDKLVRAGINRPLCMCLEALGPIIKDLERLVSNVNTATSPFLAEKMKNLRWPFHQEDIRASLGNIERLKTLISLALQTSLMEFVEKAREELANVGLDVEAVKSAILSLEADQRAHAKRIEGNLKDLDAKLQRAVDGMTAMQKTVDRNQKDQERRDVLDWLSAPDFDQKRAVAFGKHVAGTGEWFLEHPKFVAWRRGEYNVLWCPGNPGVGKSVMTSVIIHHLQEVMMEDTLVAFIYFEYITEKYTTQQLVEALLSQFVRRGMSNLGMELLQKHQAGNRPTLDELWAILRAEVGTYTRVLIVVDALDEAHDEAWIPLFEHLRDVPGISILATSRDLGNIATEFQQDRRLDIMADKGDLRKYIEERLSRSTGRFKRLVEANMPLRAEILAKVVEKADGMFLLAQLHMNALKTKSSVADLRRALGQLPGDLQSAYDATMSRISDEEKPLALRIFSWVCNAARPMKIDDLRYALAVEDGMTAIDTDFLHDQAHITSVCVGLVVSRHEKSYFGEKVYVELVHYTTRDYLRNVCAHFPHPVHLAITCLRYLAFDIFNRPLDEDSRMVLMNTPLARYAIQLWGVHARVYYSDTTVRYLAMELLRNHQRAEALGLLTCGCKGVTAVQLCAYFGLKEYLTYLLDYDPDTLNVNSKDARGNTALTVAAVRGHEEVLQLLLAREDIDVNPKGWGGATPLTRAIIPGYRGIVELLLARDDVDVNLRDVMGMTPISRAVVHGHSGIVELLLARDDLNTNLQDIIGRTPLAIAIQEEDEAIVQLLLARGDLDIGLTDRGGNTYLHFAASYNNSDQIIKLLLAKGGIDVNSRNARDQVALASAAYKGNDVIVKVLLAQEGIDVNARKCRETPLDWAITGPLVRQAGWEEIEERKRRIAKLLRAAGARKGTELGTV